MPYPVALPAAPGEVHQVLPVAVAPDRGALKKVENQGRRAFPGQVDEKVLWF